jgi:UrcA family protein
MIKPILLPIATLGAAAILTTAAVAQPVSGIIVHAHGQPDAEVKSQAVGFYDIDANSPDGARILFHRIRSAAEKVCSPEPDQIENLPQRDDMQNFARCELDSINLAVNDVNSPALSDYVDSLR